MTAFRFPGASDRTVIIGATGSGKTVFGAWILSKQRFNKRPWIIIDFKGEELWDLVQTPPLMTLKLGDMPSKKGLYRMSVLPGDDDIIEEFFRKVWIKENIGLFIDEVSLINSKRWFKALLRQGRSKRIPVISCTQRPVDCDREIFTESQFKSIFRLDDKRDYKIVEDFCPGTDLTKALPDKWSYWYDSPHRALFKLQPCPPPDTIAADLRRNVPYTSFWPF